MGRGLKSVYGWGSGPSEAQTSFLPLRGASVDDGPTKWTAADQSLVTVEADKNDTTLRRVSSVGPLGTTQVIATAQGVNGKPIATQVDVHVISAEATTGTITMSSVMVSKNAAFEARKSSADSGIASTNGQAYLVSRWNWKPEKFDPLQSFGGTVAVKKKMPSGAVPRVCDKCGKRFGSMTDPQWRNVRLIHEKTSKKHNPVSQTPVAFQ